MPKNRKPSNAGNEAPEPHQPSQTPGWATEAVRSCYQVALKLIGTGNAGILLVLAVVLSLIWHLSSTDLKDVLTALLNNQILAFLGWVFFLIVLLAGTWIVRSLRRMHERQIDQLTNLHGQEMRRILDEHRAEMDRIHPAKLPLGDSAPSVLPSPKQDQQRKPPKG